MDCGYCRASFPSVSEEQYEKLADELREQGILREARQELAIMPHTKA